MKKNFKALLLIFLFVATIALVGCGAKKEGLVGTWVYEGGSYTYVFNEDGTGSYEAFGGKLEFTYTTEGEKLSILYTGNTAPFETTYTIDGNTLNVRDSAGKDTIYKRK